MKIRVGRLIGYILTVLVTAALVAFFGGYFLFTILLVEIVVLPIDVITTMILLRSIDIDMMMDAVRAGKGDKVSLYIFLSKNTALISYEVCTYLTVRNRFYDTEGQKQIALPLIDPNYRVIPLKFSLLGYYEMTVDHITVRDMLGFADIRKQVSAETGVTIFPKKNTNAALDTVHLAGEMIEADETDRRGNDFSDVSEIREYMPGDRPRDIHWKLYAKKDELMIKQRTAMSDEQLVLVVEFTDILSENDNIVGEAYSLAQVYVQGNVNLRLMWWSTEEDDFRTVRLTEKEDVDGAFSMMLSEKAEMTEDVDLLMSSVHPEISGYIRVFSADGKVQEEAVNGIR